MRKVFIIIVILFVLFIFKTHNETSSIRVRIIPKDNQYESLVIKEKVKSITIDFLKSQYDKDYKISFLLSFKQHFDIVQQKF